MIAQVRVKDSANLRRPPGSLDVHSKHYITLGEAIRGTNIPVKTVREVVSLEITPDSLFKESAEDSFKRQVFDGCGVYDSGSGLCGQHVAEVHIRLPKNLDR